MTVRQELDLTKAIIDVVEKDLLDPATGNFYPADIQRDLQAAADVETAAKAAGVPIPDQFDRWFKIVKDVVDLLSNASKPPTA